MISRLILVGICLWIYARLFTFSSEEFTPLAVADPGFSEWEGVLFGQIGGVLAIFDQKLHENSHQISCK